MSDGSEPAPNGGRPDAAVPADEAKVMQERTDRRWIVEDTAAMMWSVGQPSADCAAVDNRCDDADACTSATAAVQPVDADPDADASAGQGPSSNGRKNSICNIDADETEQSGSRQSSSDYLDVTSPPMLAQREALAQLAILSQFLQAKALASAAPIAQKPPTAKQKPKARPSCCTLSQESTDSDLSPSCSSADFGPAARDYYDRPVYRSRARPGHQFAFVPGWHGSRQFQCADCYYVAKKSSETTFDPRAACVVRIRDDRLLDDPDANHVCIEPKYADLLQESVNQRELALRRPKGRPNGITPMSPAPSRACWGSDFGRVHLDANNRPAVYSAALDRELTFVPVAIATSKYRCSDCVYVVKKMNLGVWDSICNVRLVDERFLDDPDANHVCLQPRFAHLLVEGRKQRERALQREQALKWERSSANLGFDFGPVGADERGRPVFQSEKHAREFTFVQLAPSSHKYRCADCLYLSRKKELGVSELCSCMVRIVDGRFADDPDAGHVCLRPQYAAALLVGQRRRKAALRREKSRTDLPTDPSMVSRTSSSSLSTDFGRAHTNDNGRLAFNSATYDREFCFIPIPRCSAPKYRCADCVYVARKTNLGMSDANMCVVRLVVGRFLDDPEANHVCVDPRHAGLLVEGLKRRADAIKRKRRKREEDAVPASGVSIVSSPNASFTTGGEDDDSEADAKPAAESPSNSEVSAVDNRQAPGPQNDQSYHFSPPIRVKGEIKLDDGLLQ